MSTITINIPEVPVALATSTVSDVEVTADQGQGVINVDLGNLNNNGNVESTFQLDITNVQNGVLQSISYKDALAPVFTVEEGVSSISALVPRAKNLILMATFEITPGQPGDPAITVTADVTSTWS